MGDYATKVYTKGGDKGTTSLVGGKRVIKSDLRIEAYGTLDELNSGLGLVRSISAESRLDAAIEQQAHFETDLDRIQKDLFTIGSRLACEDSKVLAQMPQLDRASLIHLEERMDQMSLTLKPLKHFLLPGGTKTSSALHVARSVCRRAERRVVELGSHETVEPLLLEYLNRLSDYLFVASRFINQLAGVVENEWRSA